MSQATKKAAVVTEAAPIVRDIAPPYFGTGFSAFKSPPAAPGFWSAIGHDATRGGFVVQLGAKPGPPPSPYGYFDVAFAGFQYEFTPLPAPGPRYHLFTARFNPGPVSIKNNGSYVFTFCELRYLEPIGTPVSGTPVTNTPLTLNTAYSLEPSTKYKIRLRCGVQIIRVNIIPDKQPYGEVIIKDTDLNLTVYSLPIDRPEATGKNAKAAALAENGGMMEKVVELGPVSSIEEAQEKGLTGRF